MEAGVRAEDEPDVALAVRATADRALAASVQPVGAKTAPDTPIARLDTTPCR